MTSPVTLKEKSASPRADKTQEPALGQALAQPPKQLGGLLHTVSQGVTTRKPTRPSFSSETAPRQPSTPENRPPTARWPRWSPFVAHDRLTGCEQATGPDMVSDARVVFINVDDSEVAAGPVPPGGTAYVF